MSSHRNSRMSRSPCLSSLHSGPSSENNLKRGIWCQIVVRRRVAAGAGTLSMKNSLHPISRAVLQRLGPLHSRLGSGADRLKLGATKAEGQCGAFRALSCEKMI